MTIPLSALLFENGLPNLPVLLVEPHRNHKGVWRIKFCYDNDERLSMDATQATKLFASKSNRRNGCSPAVRTKPSTGRMG